MAKKNFTVVFVVLFSSLFSMIVLSANLAQFSANYLAASLEGGRDARNWSPYQGTRSGDITGSAGSRQSTVSASADGVGLQLTG